ncbi:MAG: bifunctional 4-hydroxy-3-methylbut-2-enyl diphosphate reductase/30S ribosomal protein S1, partial [Bacillota bacterium]|nr:bifunctional 4-hydroxy-3-methylbut-2-enyl diphosphate reductase/30S ribosomal protein S1 [Bacillota bacterium]
MKEIRLAECAGFCFGVREALRLTEETIRAYEGTGRRIFTYGPLIHNGQVIRELEEKGVFVLERVADAPAGSVVIVRSHGAPPSFYEEAAAAGLAVTDATCPFVKRIHRLAQEASEQGRQVAVIGNRQHPEVQGILGWAGKNARVLSSPEDAAALEGEGVTLLTQTTATAELQEAVTEAVRRRCREVKVHNTICEATVRRQESCRKLAAESDLMLVIGDSQSANTQKLYEISKKNCKYVFFVERIQDLPLKEIEMCNKISVTAGASTPERIIKEVIATMSEFTEGTEMQLEGAAEAAAEKNEALEEAVAEAAETAEAVETETAEPAEAVEAVETEAAGAVGTVEAVEAETTEAVEAAETENTEAAEVEEAAEAPEEAVEAVVEEAAEAAAKTGTAEEEADAESNQMHEFMEGIDKSLRLPGRGEIVDGVVVQVTPKEVVVNLGCKKDGILPKEEVSMEPEQSLVELFKEGDDIQAKVIKTDDGDGNILLSKRKLEVNEHWDEINLALDNKEVVSAKVVKEVKGGVIAVYKEISGFIPMSQLSDRYVEKADEFIGKVLPVKVSRVDQRRNKAVFSHKAYLAEEKQKKIKEIWDSLQVGDNVEGTVMRFTDYGAFVDIGGIDGLLHISEISWGKLKHPQEALEIGQKITVRILSMNAEKGKISLGLKQNLPEPWSVIDEKYQVDQTIEGKVVQIKEYGAFVELEPGLDGLVHISEIAFKRVTNIADEISVGQVVKAKILEIDKDRRRISLSIKEALDQSIYEEEEKAAPAAEEAEAPAAEEAPAEAEAAEEAPAEA